MKFFLWIDGKQDGPFEPEQIRAMLGAGSIAAVTLGCPEDGTGEWKPISSYEGIVEPPQCSEPTPDPPAAPEPDPPVKKPRFRWKPIAISFAVVGLILAMAGYIQYRRACKAVQDELVEYHQMENPSLDTLRTNAVNSIREDCSNEVVGLSRIVKVSMVDYEENPSKWSGTATCDFVNKVGGVERVERRYRIMVVPNSTGGVGNVYAS